MTPATLLPPNAAPLERALEASMAPRADIDPALVAAVWSPDDCPAHLLPFLAWGLSVDVWNPAWPEVTQREACRNAIRLHQLKTTPAGIRAHVALTGARVDSIVRPPARGFLRSARTDDELRAWLDRLPQVRIYPFATRARADRRAYLTGPAARHQFLGRHTCPSRGRLLAGRRATYVTGGVETPIALTTLDDGRVERVLIGGAGAGRLWTGAAHAGHGFTRSTRAARQVVTIRAADDAAAFAVSRGMEPIDVRPDRIATRRIAPRARRFLGRFGGALRASAAPLLIYDRIALHDEVALGARRDAVIWCGRTRLGMPAFTAEVRVAVPMTRSRRRTGRWTGVGFLRAGDTAPLTLAIEAVSAAKAARDTILVNPNLHATATFGQGLRFGDFTFGQTRKVH